jgi:gamma-glutamyl-gamma-aminobutyrate hydrolase PuuD
MKIAITQRPTTINGFDYDATSQGWYNLLPKHKILPIANHETIDSIDFDMLIISGGEDSTTRHFVEQQYFELALEQNKPVLGVCHGAFFINEYFGGLTKNIENHQGVEHSVFLEGNLHTVNSYHKLAIDKLSKNLAAVSRDTSSNVEAYKHKKLSIWGLVWHPERMDTPLLPKGLKELLLG